MNGRRLQLALLLSLGLNLFLVGLLVGGLLMKPRGKAESGRPRGAGHYWAAAAAVDPADRAAFQDLLRQESREAAPRLNAMRQARREARNAVSGGNFDPAAAQAALARAHAEEFAVRRDVDAAVLAFAARLYPDERAALGEAMRRPKRRGGSGGRDRR